MKKTLVEIKKFNRKSYKIYLVEPKEKFKPFVFVETPQNRFGNIDTIFFDKNGKGYGVHKSHHPSIMMELEKINNDIMERIYL